MSMKCMYLLTPVNPHFYIEKLGFAGVYLFFLFLLKTQIVTCVSGNFHFLGSSYCSSYSTVSVMFISLTLTNVEFRMSRDFFPWILRGTSVDFA